MAFWQAHVDLFAQIAGFIAMGLTILSFQFRKHSWIMAFMTASSVFWVLHYAMLELWPAAAINTMNMLRNYIYGLREKKNVNSPLVPAFFVIVAAVSVIATWENGWSALPLLASVTATVANWQTQTKKLKLLSYPRYGLWLVYDLINRAWAGAANDAFTMGSITVSLVKERLDEKKAREEIPAGPALTEAAKKD